MNFKIGDRVKLIRITESEKNCSIGEEYVNALNKIFTIERIHGTCADLKGTIITPYLSNLELAIFTKSDLQDGDIVTYRDNEQAVVVQKETKLIGIKNLTLMYLADYDEKLNHKTGKHKGTINDIIKVERPTQYEIVFERKKEILDESEKEYLRNVIRPWRDKVKGIVKEKLNDKNWISIDFKNDACMDFPNLDKKEDYKNMEAGKMYTLEELGL